MYGNSKLDCCNALHTLWFTLPRHRDAECSVIVSQKCSLWKYCLSTSNDETCTLCYLNLSSGSLGIIEFSLVEMQMREFMRSGYTRVANNTINTIVGGGGILLGSLWNMGC